MDNRILLAGAAVLVVGAAFAGGYYVNHTPAPPAPAAVPASAPAVTPPVETAAPAMAPVAEPAPVAAVQAKPVVKKRRVPDYASGETAYAPPPPPPPPPRDFGGPNPFEARFATFPMRHSGSGTLDSPLTWTAQTAIGHGHEADLRISLVVPMPPPNDRGAFWSKWGTRGGDDVMPQITRGTPVVVAASASVVLAIDPQVLDLDAPAVLSVNGRDGQRIYRSRDVAPARGESWNEQGARWIFQPDADFFRLVRGGADISVSFRSRLSPNPITVPFATDDLPPSLNGFEHDLYARMSGIAAAWDRARPGAPPPREANNPPPGFPPPSRGPMPPQNGWQPSNGPQPDNGPQHGWQHRPQQQDESQRQASVPPNAPPPAAQPMQPAPRAGNPPEHAGNHAHDHGAPSTASTPPAPPKPNPPPAMTAPAKAPPAPPPVTQPAKPAPQAPVAAPPPKPAAANPGAAAIAAEVAAYRPPTDSCGPQPHVPQTLGVSPERKQANAWLKCRTQWLNAYRKSINMLSRDAAKQHAPLQTVSGGSAIIADFEKAQGELGAQKAALKQ